MSFMTTQDRARAETVNGAECGSFRSPVAENANRREVNRTLDRAGGVRESAALL